MSTAPASPTRSTLLVTLWAVCAAFVTYFCMYAFRKPYQALSYEGTGLFGMETKTTLVLAQTVGYMTSKYLGIYLCSSLRANRRRLALLGLIVTAELALVAFALLPENWRPLAMLLNGLPLGMVWGLVVRYLEGRRSSEILLSGLSVSYIFSSGIVKDVARAFHDGWLASLDSPLAWTPAVTGLCFLPLFALSVTLLDRVPPPTTADASARTERRAMSGAERLRFLRAFGPGLALQLALYFAITAFRDFRDIYGIEILEALELQDDSTVFTRMELLVGLGVLGSMASLALIRNNRAALAVNFLLMAIGGALIGTSTWLWQRGELSGFAWLTQVGLGGYLVYVWNASSLFDRVVAAARHAGTAVFAIQLMDSVGYTGSLCLQLYKDLAAADTPRLDFFVQLCEVTTILALVIPLCNMVWFDRRVRREASSATGQP